MTGMALFTCRVTERWPGSLVFSPSPTPPLPADIDEWDCAVRDVLEHAIGGRSCTLVTFAHDDRKHSLAWALPGTFRIEKGKGGLWLTPVQAMSSSLLTEVAESWEFTAQLLWIVVGQPAPEAFGPAVDALVAADRSGERPQTELEVIAPMDDHAELWWVNAGQDPARVAAALAARSSISWHIDDAPPV